MLKAGPHLQWVSLESSGSTCDQCTVMSNALTGLTAVDLRDVGDHPVDADRHSSASRQSSAGCEDEDTEQAIFDSMTKIATTVSEMEQMVVKDDNLRQPSNNSKDADEV